MQLHKTVHVGEGRKGKKGGKCFHEFRLFDKRETSLATQHVNVALSFRKKVTWRWNFFNQTVSASGEINC